MSIPSSYSILVRGVTVSKYAAFATVANRIAVHKDQFEHTNKYTLHFYVDVHEGLTICDIMSTLAALYELGCTVHVTNV